MDELVRKRVGIGGYDRERGGRVERVRDYDQVREVRGGSPPSMAALRRPSLTSRQAFEKGLEAVAADGVDRTFDLSVVTDQGFGRFRSHRVRVTAKLIPRDGEH